MWNDDWGDEKLVAISLGQITHWWEGTNYVLDELCVSPDYQGSGLGSRFMK